MKFVNRPSASPRSWDRRARCRNDSNAYDGTAPPAFLRVAENRSARPTRRSCGSCCATASSASRTAGRWPGRGYPHNCRPNALQILRIRGQRFHMAGAKFQRAQQPIILALIHLVLGTRRQPSGQGLRRLVRLQAWHAVVRQMRLRGVHQAGFLDIVFRNGFRGIAFEQLVQPIRLFEVRRHLHHGHAGRHRARRKRHGLQERCGGAFTCKRRADPAVLRDAVRPAEAADIRAARPKQKLPKTRWAW